MNIRHAIWKTKCPEALNREYHSWVVNHIRDFQKETGIKGNIRSDNLESYKQHEDFNLWLIEKYEFKA